MKKTIKKILVLQAKLQFRVIGMLAATIPNKKAKMISSVLTNYETMHRLEQCIKGMHVLPTLPGSQRFKDNMKYTVPFFEYLENRFSEAVSSC